MIDAETTIESPHHQEQQQQDATPPSVAPTHQPHVNYAWRSLERVKYERFPSGGRPIAVCPPNAREPIELVEPHLVLKTAALDSHRAVHSRCAHYHFNDACAYGARCKFIHTVHLDPTARPYQKARLRRREANPIQSPTPMPTPAHSPPATIPAASLRFDQSDTPTTDESSPSVSDGAAPAALLFPLEASAYAFPSPVYPATTTQRTNQHTPPCSNFDTPVLSGSMVDVQIQQLLQSFNLRYDGGAQLPAAAMPPHIFVHMDPMCASSASGNNTLLTLLPPLQATGYDQPLQYV